MSNNFKLSTFAKCTMFATLLAATQGAWAEDEAYLGTIEVTAVANDGKSKVDSSKIEVRQADHIKDILRDIPGVYVGGTNAYNQTIDIRNVNEKGINITVDGARQLGDTFHHNGNLLVDPELLKRVDVSVGTNSVTDGQGALGGAVKFTTVDASDLLRGSDRPFGFKVKLGYATNNKAFKKSGILYGSIMKKVDLLAYINHVNSDFGETPIGSQTGGDATEMNYLLKGTINFNDSNKLSLSHESINLDGYYRFRANIGALKDQQNNLDQIYTRETTTLKYELNPLTDWVDLKASAYRTKHELDRSKPQRNMKPEDLAKGKGWIVGSETYGFRIDNTSIARTGSVGHTIRLGYEFYQTENSKTTVGFVDKKKTDHHHEKGTNHSIYIEDAIKWKGLTVTPGLRYDHYTADMIGNYKKDYDNVTKALGVNYNFGNGFSVFANYTDLFRAPATLEAIRLDTPDKYKQEEQIKPETGSNKEIGFNYTGSFTQNRIDSFSLTAKAYQTDYKNLIIQAAVPGVSALVQRYNAGKAKSRGFEANVRYRYDNFSIGLGASYTDTDTPEGREVAGKGGKKATKYGDILRTASGPKFSLNLGYKVPRWDMTFNWNSLFIGKFDKNGVKKPGFGVSDFSVSWAPSKGKLKGLEATVGVYNIFDKLYLSHTANANDYEPGRNIKLTVSYKF